MQKRYYEEIKLLQDSNLLKAEELYSEILRSINTLYAFCVMGIDKTNCSYFHYENKNTPLNPIKFELDFNEYLEARTQKDFCYTVSVHASFFDEIYTALTDLYGEDGVEVLDNEVYFYQSYTFSVQSGDTVIKIKFLPQFDLLDGVVSFRNRINKSNYVNLLKGQNPECILGFLMKDKKLTTERKRRLKEDELPF